MNPEKFKEIREKLKLTQSDLAEVFGFSGKAPISHYETGFRVPSPLVEAFMLYLNGLSERKAREFLEDFERHMKKALTSQRGKA